MIKIKAANHSSYCNDKEKKMKHSILISGAAQGIGAEIARVFYQRGYKVGIYDINESLAQNLAQELGPNACAGYLDVSDYSQWQHILKEFTDWAGELNILVNNAGFYIPEPLKISISSHTKEQSILM